MLSAVGLFSLVDISKVVLKPDPKYQLKVVRLLYKREDHAHEEYTNRFVMICKAFCFARMLLS